MWLWAYFLFSVIGNPRCMSIEHPVIVTFYKLAKLKRKVSSKSEKIVWMYLDWPAYHSLVSVQKFLHPAVCLHSPKKERTLATIWIWLNHVICPKQNLLTVNFFMNLNSLTLRYSGMCFLNNKKIVMVFLCEFLLLLLLCAITKFRSAKNSLRSSWSPFQQKEKRNLRKMTIVSLSTKRGRNFSQMMQVWGTFWGY